MRDALAEYERAKLLERTERGRLGRARAGHPWGGQVPLGYRVIREPHKARWEVDDEEAALVRRIFALCLSGQSVRDIAWVPLAAATPARRASRRLGCARLPLLARAVASRGSFRWARGGRWRGAGRRRRVGGQVARHRVGAHGWWKRPFVLPILPNCRQRYSWITPSLCESLVEAMCVDHNWRIFSMPVRLGRVVNARVVRRQYPFRAFNGLRRQRKVIAVRAIRGKTIKHPSASTGPSSVCTAMANWRRRSWRRDPQESYRFGR